ncbi:MAG: CDP-alcohol phosphatidyltransferase family protein [Gloeobacteraceae cyanobacterium ES-bin-144]|nr:CDP-alcohol phosphatidyltransferase family protein [Verrucomicrobiales bacterium]
MPPDTSRRPLKSRSSAWAAWSAGFLARAGASPNGISAASVIMALLGAAAFIAAGNQWLVSWLGWILAAICIQLRLICNLLDGMVAIEGGMRSATGGIWNEAPDRFADTILLISAGIGCAHPWAGAAAAWAAVMTAYVRALGKELTGKQDFCGPFAKPQRMAALTIGALFSPIEFLWGVNPPLLAMTLWLIVIGTFITIFRRLWRLSNTLKSLSR